MNIKKISLLFLLTPSLIYSAAQIGRKPKCSAAKIIITTHAAGKIINTANSKREITSKDFVNLIKLLTKTETLKSIKNNKLYSNFISDIYNSKIKLINNIVDEIPKLEERTPNSGFTILHETVLADYLELVTILLKIGANPNAISTINWSPIHIACQTGNIVIFDLLVQFGANINSYGDKRHTPLHLAAQNGHIAIVDKLILGGANVMASKTDNWTALHIAAQFNQSEIIKKLIKEKADINAQTNGVESPIMPGEDDWDHNGRPVKDKQYNVSLTALDIAIANGYVNLSIYLLNNGATINPSSEVVIDDNLATMTEIWKKVKKIGASKIVNMLLPILEDKIDLIAISQEDKSATSASCSSMDMQTSKMSKAIIKELATFGLDIPSISNIIIAYMYGTQKLLK